MSWRSQRGTTLIELVVAISVTAVVIVGMAGIVFAANQVTRVWGQRTYLAEAAALLPNRLQADAHAYVPCKGSPDGAELHLCLPDGEEAVVYAASGNCPCEVTRTDHLAGTRESVTRNLVEPPLFQTSCAAAGPVAAGRITMTIHYGGDLAAQPPLVVPFRAPLGGCGP